MASTIKLKNSATSGNAPSSLETGEVAINVTDGNLFYGSASAVLQNFVINELEVKGNLTAQQYTISSSVTNVTFQQQSGSTIFGDTLDDTHLFTGSISVTGSVVSNGVTLTGDQDLSSLATIVQLNASSSTLQTNIDTKIDTSGTPADNQISVFTDADTIEGSSKLVFVNDQVTGFSVRAANSDAAAVTVVGGVLGSAPPKLGPSGSHSTLRMGLDTSGDIFDFQNNKIAFDHDSTNTYIQADTSNPENLEIHADGNIELRADNNLEIHGPISTAITASSNISSSGTITGNSLVGTVGTATQGTIDHDSLANFVANEHIDHSGVSITAGAGLTGGGTIASTRDIAVGAGTGVTVNADDIAIGQDVATTANVQFANITGSAISSSGTITGNSIVGTLATAAQTNITSVGTLGSLTLGGDIDMDGNTLNMNAGEITDAASVRSLQFGSTTDQDLTITSDGNITFKLDDDNDETSQSFKFQNDNTEIASLNESGDLQLNGNITSSGNISASGDIFCTNITIAEDITSVGDDIILKDNLVVSSSAGVVSFRGTAGGSNEGITYIDSAGGARYALILPGSDVVALTNRAADGIVQIRVSNASGGGSSNEITVAEYVFDKITHNVKSEIRLEKTSTTDADYNGDVVFFGGTTSMTKGRIYHFKSDGTWELANPNAVATSDGLLAVALGAASDTNGMLLKGMVTLDHDPGAVGDVLYLDEQQVSSAYGAATSGAPAGTGDVVRIIGYCLDASNGQIYFDPSKDHIVHA